MKKLAAIVLAAGKGTRMKSERPKVMHPVAGKPMLFYPLRALERLGAEPRVVVIGYGAEEVRTCFSSPKVRFRTQEPQLGTGHAVMCALKSLRGESRDGDVLILSGDIPLITETTLKGLIKLHRRAGKPRPVLTLLTAMLDDPDGYGRVVRDRQGAVAAVVESKDASPAQSRIKEINASIYLASLEFLVKNIKRLGTGNAQNEYYLPDLVALAARGGHKVRALTHMDASELMGVNNRVELACANLVMRERINECLMLSGVTLLDPARTYIDYGVRVGRDTTIYPGTHLVGDTRIGKGCVVEEGARIEDSVIGNATRVRSYSVIESSRTGTRAVIGPWARLRPGSVIGAGAHVGNFVEVKNSRIGAGSKANHLSYLGDAEVGAGVNIGAGTITCNYDGRKKHKTVIKDNVFVGSDSQLVAPVTIGKGAYIGSGSTITKDVPPGALALSRAEQKVIRGWVESRGLKKVKKRGHRG